MTKEIPLQNGMVAIVDAEDYEQCMEYVWHCLIRNNRIKSVERSIKGKGKDRYLSFFILPYADDEFNIHRNENLLDFTKSNLKTIKKEHKSRYQKGQRGSVSKYKGVHKLNGKWAAQINISGRAKYLGCYFTEVEAAEAYNVEAQKNWGNECYLNILEENNIASSTDDWTVEGRRLLRNSTGYRGVYLVKKTGNFTATVHSDGKPIRLGTFTSAIEAAKAYDKKAIELHGDKAILNFPDEDGTKI